MPLTARPQVEPPRPGKLRKRGERKPQVAFRAPKHIEELLERREREGHSKTDTVLDLAQLAYDIQAELGPDYFEIERISKVEGLAPGKIIAGWARSTLERRRK